jgi:hypothetical protein
VRRYLDRWTRELVRRGLRSGLIEGSNLWLAIGAIAWLLRFLSRRQAPKVSVESLRLGESIVVSHVPAPPRTRRARKKALRKAEKLEQRSAKLQAKAQLSRRDARAAAEAARAQAAEAEKLDREQARAGKARRRRHGKRSTARRRSEGDLEAPRGT